MPRAAGPGDGPRIPGRSRAVSHLNNPRSLAPNPLIEREQDNRQEIGHADRLGEHVATADEPGPSGGRADESADVPVAFGLSALAHNSAVTIDDLGNTRAGRSHGRPGRLRGAVTGHAGLLLPLGIGVAIAAGVFVWWKYLRQRFPKRA